MYMRRLLAAILLVILLLVSVNDCFAESYLTREEAVEDADYLWHQLEDVHPSLYFYTSRDEAAGMMAEIKKQLQGKEKWTPVELYRLLAPFVAGFRDGHTSLSVNYLFREYGEDIKLFPVMVDIGDRGIEVVNDLGSGDIPQGSEIFSINGINTGEIIETIKSGVSHEREEFAYIKMASAFPLYLWAFYGMDNNYQIVYKTEKGNIKPVSLTGIGLKEYKTRKQEVITAKETKNWSINFPSNGTALLTINTFNGRLEEEFKTFVKNSFQDIKKRNIDYLIIDLRQNGGGSTTLSDYLYEFISDKPYRTFAEVHIKYSSLSFKKANFLLKLYYLLKGEILGEETIVYRNKFKEPGPNDLRFEGEVFVLTGPRTFSTATDFAALIKDLKAGIIVGVETGGLATCYGDLLYDSLPNSGLKAGISYKYFVRPGGFDDGRGVLPDIEVETDPVLKAQGIDLALEKVLEIISEE